MDNALDWTICPQMEFADLKELFDHNDFVHGVGSLPKVEETKGRFVLLLLSGANTIEQYPYDQVEFADSKELFDHNDFVHGVAPKVEETKADGEEVEFADLKELFDHNDFVHGVAPKVEETKADGEEVDEFNFFI
ncbi:hypothetical protein Tco_1140120 [Tanacetum coccineum]